MRLLQDEFHRLQRRNPRFSMRSFAKKLGLSPSTLSDLINRKRPVTRKLAARILKRVGAPQDLGALLLTELRDRYDPTPGEFIPLSVTDPSDIISKWHYYAILSLSETIDFVSDPNWVARRLGLHLKVARDAIEQMLALKMLTMDSNGKLKSTGLQFMTTHDIPSSAIKEAHRENLVLARRALEKEDVHRRDFTAMTMAIDPDRLPEAKKRITRFRRELCAYLESGKKKEVYKVCIQLFPLSAPTKGQSE